MEKTREVVAMTVSPGKELIPEEDLKMHNSFFLNQIHSVPPRCPLFGYYCSRIWAHSMSYATEMLCIPGSKGVDYRHYRGAVYVTLYLVEDEEERKERAAKFQRNMVYWFENFESLWEKAKQDLLEGAVELRSFDFDRATPLQLIEWIHKSITRMYWMWEKHMEFLYPSCVGYLLLGELTQKHFGISRTDPRFQKLLSGSYNKIYEINERLSNFAGEARRVGLEQVFIENEPKDILEKLQQTESGKRWLEDFMKFLEVDGWWPLTLQEFRCTYWLEDPTIPLEIVKNNLVHNVVFDLSAVRTKLIRERQEILDNLLTLIPEVEKEYFKKVHTLALKIAPFVEEHTFYCEYIYHTALRYGYLRIAKRLCEGGAIGNPDDIFFLTPPEIEAAVMNYMELSPLVEMRRRLYEEWCAKPNPLIFTTRSSIEEAVEKDIIPSYDPVFMSHVIGEIPVAKEELKADLYGVPGSPGEVEGVARVIFSYRDMDQVQPGEILVTISTDSNWTPVFPLLKGLVTEQGGVLCHAAITAREFAIPAVVGARGATSKIRTKDRIKVVGDHGVVYILERQ